MSDVLLIARAWNFSAKRHAKQRRKGEAQEPYVNHLAEVAELVATATEGHDANLVAAAVLHDTVEDTATLLGELASIFNVEHASAKTTRAKILKLADKISNLRSLVRSPPADWSLERKSEYLSWSRDVVQGLRGASAWL